MANWCFTLCAYVHLQDLGYNSFIIILKSSRAMRNSELTKWVQCLASCVALLAGATLISVSVYAEEGGGIINCMAMWYR